MMICINGDDGAKSSAVAFAEKHKLTMPHFYVDSVHSVYLFFFKITYILNYTYSMHSITQLIASVQTNDKICCAGGSGFGVKYIPHVVSIGADGKVIKNKVDASEYKSLA